MVSATARAKPLVPLNDDEATVIDDGVGENGYGWPIVTGTIENETDSRLERAMEYINFYRDRELLGQARNAASRLGSDGRAESSASMDRCDVFDVTRHTVVTTARK